MGSECNPNPNPSRRRYDITMSKRTRRSFYLEHDSSEQEDVTLQIDSFLAMTDSPEAEEAPEEVPEILGSPEKEEKGESKSFEQLIKGEKDKGELKKGRSSLGQHFTDEEKLQVVVRKQKQEGAEGLKFKGLVRRYAKVLSHLMKKNNHEPRKGSRKKPVLQLTM